MLNDLPRGRASFQQSLNSSHTLPAMNSVHYKAASSEPCRGREGAAPCDPVSSPSEGTDVLFALVQARNLLDPQVEDSGHPIITQQP